MSIEEPGVLWRDGIHFWSEDAFTHKNLFYPMWGAVYELDVPYRVERDYMDACMVQYIERGSLCFHLRKQTFRAQAGELVLLGCKEPNLYWSEEPARVRWFHFNGQGVAPLLEFVYAKHGDTGKLSKERAARCLPYIDSVLAGLKLGSQDPFHFSQDIYGMLCEMAAQPPGGISSSKEAVQRSIEYMKQHYREELSVQDVASSVGLSPYYYSRVFKKLLSVSPHAYLLGIRLDAAKNRLVYTADTVEIIAQETGFQSSSYFIRAFRRAMNMTPQAFRNYFSTFVDAEAGTKEESKK